MPKTGYHQTLQHKAKISRAMMGKRKCGVECRLKLSKAFKGKKLSKEHRLKISKSMKGKNRKGFSEEYKRKMSISIKKLWSNPLFAEKVSKGVTKAQRGRKLSKETREKLSKYHLEFYKNPENRKRHRERMNDPKTKAKLSSKIRNLWKNPEHAKKMWRSFNRKPNIVEKRTDMLLQKICPNEFRYVGNGEFILGGRCPDFMNVNGKKKLIEVYGDYWHKNDDPQERINFFKEYGFDTLVIWEHELDLEEEIVRKITDFIA